MISLVISKGITTLYVVNNMSGKNLFSLKGNVVHFTFRFGCQHMETEVDFVFFLPCF